MKKIAWVTSDCYLDTDLPIIKCLENDNKYLIHWYVILPKGAKINNWDSIIKNSITNSIIHIHIHKLRYRLSSIFTFFQLLNILLRAKSHNIDLLYIDAEIDPYFSILAKLIFGGKKIIFAIHDVIPHLGFSKKYQYVIDTRVNLFENFHIFSKTQQNYFTNKYKSKNKKTFQIPQLLKDFGSPSSDISEKSEKVNFLFFGTLRSNKGIDLLIDAINKLTITHKGRFEMTIAGFGKDWSIYENKIFDKSVFNLKIRIIGNNEIADLFNLADYIVLPYRDVTQSGPLMIAYNYGIPPIASNLEGFSEYIEDNINGFLFKDGDVQSLYEKFIYVIENNNENLDYIKLNLSNFINSNLKDSIIKSEYECMFDSILMQNN
ncbi:MAG: glycosyltransferase family 4 protein [Bacteroidales bacterium]